MKLRAKNVMYYKYGSRSKALRSCELKYDSGNDFIEVVITDSGLKAGKTVHKVEFSRDLRVDELRNRVNNGYYSDFTPRGDYNFDFHFTSNEFFRKLVRAVWESSSRNIFISKSDKNIMIGNFNTGIPVQYMGEMYGIYFYDNYGNRIPEFLFSKEKVSELVGEYIEENYYY